jgi:hypothetical protein
MLEPTGQLVTAMQKIGPGDEAEPIMLVSSHSGVGFMPNMIQTMVAMLAATSICAGGFA